MMINALARLTLLLVVTLAGCVVPEAPPPTEARAHPVDSILPPEVELQHFRAGIAQAPAGLEAGAPSREELVRRFVDALEAGDTLAITALAISRAEFAYLYYPSSQYARDPYRMSPALLWFMIGENSHKGSTRAVRRYGGRPLGYTGHRCDPEPRREGENLLWTGCVLLGATPLEARQPGATSLGAAPAAEAGVRLFGSIVERQGRFKFVSFANPL